MSNDHVARLSVLEGKPTRITYRDILELMKSIEQTPQSQMQVDAEEFINAMFVDEHGALHIPKLGMVIGVKAQEELLKRKY